MKTFQRIVSSLYANEHGSYSLIGLLAGLVITMVLALILLGGPEIFSGGKSGSGPAGSAGIGGGVGGAIAVRNEAQEVTCKNNLQQLRLGIQMVTQNAEGTPPQTLEEVAQANPGLKIACPVGGEPYQYDPVTGQVTCVHPGHERF